MSEHIGWKSSENANLETDQTKKANFLTASNYRTI